MAMASAAYELLDPAAWASIRSDIAAERNLSTPEWGIRAFGLDGWVKFSFGAETFRWGGFLLDFACGMAEWLAHPRATFTFRPLEQANNVEVELVDGRVIFRSDVQVVSTSLDLAVEGIRDFLGQVSSDVLRHAPELAAVPGFDWLARYLPPTT